MRRALRIPNSKLRTRIIEVFSSIQGEGLRIGERQIFIRFFGCNLQCAFCDTDSRAESREVSVEELAEEVRVINRKSGPHRFISITGGEPLLHDEYLKALLPMLRDEGFKIYLETNGTLPHALRQLLGLVDVVAMDMKLPSSTRMQDLWSEHREFLEVARLSELFLKMVITSQTTDVDLVKGVSLIAELDDKIPLVLQPVTPCGGVREASQTKLKGFQRISEQRLKEVRIIPQLHKLIGVK